MSILDTLMFWKHKDKEEVIKPECFDKLPEHRKVMYVQTKQQPTHYVEEVDRTSADDDGFITSMIIGAATDSTLLGAAIGGNVAGAMIGDMLNDSDSTSSNDISFDGFGGGDTGGGGAGGDWGSDDSSFDSSSDSFDSSSSFDSSFND